MEYPFPVVLNSARPARNRGRLNSEHPNRQTFYLTDQNGMLVPTMAGDGGGRHRSSSTSGPFPTGAVIINNEQWTDVSPSRSSHRRRNSHGHDHHYSDDDDWDDHHSRHRRRSHSRVRPSRTPSPYYDSETENRLKKLKELEKKEAEDEARERYEEEMILKEARKAKKKKEEEELKKKTIEAYEIKKLEDKAKAEEKQREEDEMFHSRAIKTFAKAGYSEEAIEKLLKKAEKKGGKGKEGKEIMDLSRPTYIKVHKKHLSAETLDEYDLPWEYDEVSDVYVPIRSTHIHPPNFNFSLSHPHQHVTVHL